MARTEIEPTWLMCCFRSDYGVYYDHAWYVDHLDEFCSSRMMGRPTMFTVEEQLQSVEGRMRERYKENLRFKMYRVRNEPQERH